MRIAPTTLKDTYHLCSGERFEEQPAAATCSGVLIDKDLLITAGHCIETDRGMQDVLVRLRLRLRRGGQARRGERERCLWLPSPGVAHVHRDEDRLRHHTARSRALGPRSISGSPWGHGGDHSRRCHGLHQRAPAQGRSRGRGAGARSSQYDFFALNSDTFEGSSGSAILDENYQLAGVLVRGGNDYQKTSSGCSVAEVVPADAGMPEWRWEQATYAGAAVDVLCGEGYPSQLLCGVDPSCGDGVCSLDAVDENCPEDCAAFCRENACTKGVGSVAPGAPVAQAERASMTAKIAA